MDVDKQTHSRRVFVIFRVYILFHASAAADAMEASRNYLLIMFVYIIEHEIFKWEMQKGQSHEFGNEMNKGMTS